MKNPHKIITIPTELTITGLTIYDGPSKLNGQDIIAVATLKSKNSKTGNLVQVHILPKNLAPTEAINSGQDKSVCQCQLRGILQKQTIEGKVTTRNKGRICYCLAYQAPTNIWKKFQAGGYPQLDKTTAFLIKGRQIRLGAIGDPSAIPMKVWDKLLKLGNGHTSYTHQWDRPKYRYLNKFSQASTHTMHDTMVAQAINFRTFRISQTGEPIRRLKERVCLATFGKQCSECMLCNGNRANIVIKIHGSKAKIRAFRKLQNT